MEECFIWLEEKWNNFVVRDFIMFKIVVLELCEGFFLGKVKVELIRINVLLMGFDGKVKLFFEMVVKV